MIKSEHIQIQSDAYLHIFKIENLLRLLILQQFENNFQFWNTFLKNNKTFANHLFKEQNKHKINRNTILIEPIFYTSLNEIFKIIMTIDFKRFSIIVESKAKFQNDMEKIIKIRNDVMHSRMINDAELNKIKSFCSELETTLSFDTTLDKFYNVTVMKLSEIILNDLYSHQDIFGTFIKVQKSCEVNFLNYKYRLWWTIEKFVHFFGYQELVDYYTKIELLNAHIKEYLLNNINKNSLMREYEKYHFDKYCIENINRIERSING